MPQKKGQCIPKALTDEFIQKVCDQIRIGNYASIASERFGVPQPTFSLWKSKGKDKDFAGTIYEKLAEAVAKAEAEFETIMVAKIHAAGNLNANQLTWLLSRRFPDRWGDKQKIEHSEGGPSIDVSKLTDEELAAYDALFSKARKS